MAKVQRTLSVRGWTSASCVRQMLSQSQNGAGLWMRVDSPTPTPLAFDNMQARPIKGTLDWRR